MCPDRLLWLLRVQEPKGVAELLLPDMPDPFDGDFGVRVQSPTVGSMVSRILGRPKMVNRANFLALGIRPRFLSSVSPAFTLFDPSHYCSGHSLRMRWAGNLQPSKNERRLSFQHKRGCSGRSCSRGGRPRRAPRLRWLLSTGGGVFLCGARLFPLGMLVLLEG